MADACSNPVFVISGVSTGLGEALCRQLLELGKMVVCIGRNFTAEQRAAAEKHSAKLIACDLSSSDGLNNLALETALAGHDAVTFFSNAGTVAPIGLAGAVNLSAMSASFNLNVLAPAAIVSAILRATAGSDIKLTFFNISSGAARHAIAGWSAYCAGKAAASAYFNCLALERTDIKVVERDPGVMDTAMQAIIRAHTPTQFPRHDEFMRLKEDNKLNHPDTVAAAILGEAGVT